MNDPANSRAISRSCLGLSRELEQDCTDLPPNLRIGGTQGYPLWFRMRVLNTTATALSSIMLVILDMKLDMILDKQYDVNKRYAGMEEEDVDVDCYCCKDGCRRQYRKHS